MTPRTIPPRALVEAALALAATGLPVFPCRDNKAPVTRRGLYDASTDPAEVRRMFAHPERHVEQGRV